MNKTLTTLVIVFVFIFAIYSCHLKIDQIEPRENKINSYCFLPDPKLVCLFSLGHNQFLADCFWLAFIQYYGDSKARLSDHYQLAYRYLNLIVHLDPQFTQAYWFAAFVLGSDAGEPTKAAKLIEYGIEKNQNNWYLPYIAGINQYLFAHNEKKAAQYYRRALQSRDAPSWLASLARMLESGITTRLKKIHTWQIVYNSAPNGQVKRQARNELITLWTEVYSKAPSQAAKNNALIQLNALGKT